MVAENLFGFLYPSTADHTQILVRIHEDTMTLFLRRKTTDLPGRRNDPQAKTVRPAKGLPTILEASALGQSQAACN